MQASLHKKPRVALMTYAIDGRRAKGTAIVARKCVEALLERRDEFDLTFIHYEKSDDPIYSHGVREVILPEFRPHFFNRRSLRQIYYFLTTKDVYDIAHWFQPRVYPFFWVAPATHLVVTLHTADYARAEYFNLMTEVFLWTLKLFRKKITIAIAVSEYARRVIIKVYGFEFEKVRVLNNGVESIFTPASPEAIAVVREKYSLPAKFFLNVARLNPSKNAFRVIRSFDRFARENPQSQIHFVNVGADGFDKQLVEEFLNKSPCKDRIHLIDYIDAQDLPAVYSAAFALVFPLLNDGFGLPILEAMACGTPVVASDTALPEITRDDALLVDAMNEEDIAEAMRTLVTDPDLREKLVHSGLTKARLFTWEEMTKKLIEIYRGLMRVNA